ncbi:MAG: DUF6438 domain-containing protein [Flavobacteriales bacterium]|nr:DUF6438 domain-containing protein [Flavobacteriales bacterium]
MTAHLSSRLLAAPLAGSIITALLMISHTSCSPTQELANTKDAQQLVVRLDRSPCFGPCPTYTFSLYAEGRATYDGRRFTTLDGQHHAQATPEQLDRILAVARALQFSELDSIYDDPRVMDLPAQTFTIEGHCVLNRYGGPDLSPLLDAIESVVAELNWRKLEE